MAFQKALVYTESAMKGAPSREPTPFEKFSAAVKKFMRTPKAEVDARDEAWRAERARTSLKGRKKRPA